MPIEELVKPGNVAIVTGAASGIGRAACERFAQSGMSLCLVDLPDAELTGAAEAISSVHPNGAKAVAACPIDLSAPGAMQTLEACVLPRFGKVNLLMNNAVTRTGRGLEAGLDEWRKAMEVNFWAVVEAVRTFLPHMPSAGEPGVIINVGSKQGITNPPGHPVYNITKTALKTYTEALEHELRSSANGSISAHLLVPGWTTTGGKAHQAGAWLPGQVIDFMLDGLERGDFYILCPDDEVTSDMDHRRIIWGAQDITQNRPPLSRWHPDFSDEAKKHCS